MTTKELLNAAVYCGTYKKYASGNLAGDWLQLASYKDGLSFLEACKKLHKDEKEPEFMFQDTEYLPDEYYSESCIYPEIFAVIQVVKTMAEDERTAFDNYCEANAAIPELFDIEEFKQTYKAVTVTPPATPSGNQNALEELLGIIKAKSGEDYKNYFAAAIKIKDGYFMTFQKPDIKKAFCFGYSDFGQGMTQEEAEEACANFGEEEFKESNLSDFDGVYEYRTKLLDMMRPDITLETYGYSNRGYTGCSITSDPNSGSGITLKGEEADKFREEYKATVTKLRADFEKKINSYLKRYGVSKIRKWTFWADE